MDQKYDRWFKDVGKNLISECNKKADKAFKSEDLKMKFKNYAPKTTWEIKAYQKCKDRIKKSKAKYGL